MASTAFVHYLPIATTLFAALFAFVLLDRYREKGGAHLAWWGAGAIAYGVGTFVEAYTTLFGWHEWSFRTWYIAGALLGGMPLAQGTVYLLLPRRTAHVLTAIVIPFVAFASFFVLLSPIDAAQVEPHRLAGRVLEWSWVRLFSPFLNLYAVVFLIGGAIVSAIRYLRGPGARHRVIGNALIAIGAILPGIGGGFARAGYTEVLYVTELVGLVGIYWGYWANVLGAPTPKDDAAALVAPSRA